MDIETLRRKLEAREPLTVLDIRDDESRAEWSIPGSVHLDLYDDPSRIVDYEPPPGRPVVAVCYAGNRSRVAAQALRARGYDAASLEGGMGAWSLAWNTAEMKLASGASLVQVRRTGKGCLSYLVGAGSDALVVDASLPSDVYLSLAKERGWALRHVVDTHVHADHLSRGLALAQASGATFHLPQTTRAKYPFAPLAEADELRVGTSVARVMRTPGHTDESACLLVDGEALLTGDTVFHDGVGRPDLETDPAGATKRARELHASLQRIFALDERVRIFSGHASEPVPFDHEPVAASVADVRTRLKLEPSADDFARRLVARLPPTPPNHKIIVQLNEAGTFPAGHEMQLEAGANRCAIR